MQTAVVKATMGVHNFLRQVDVVDEAFIRAATDPEATEVELLDERNEIEAELHAQKSQEMSVIDSEII